MDKIKIIKRWDRKHFFLYFLLFCFCVAVIHSFIAPPKFVYTFSCGDGSIAKQKNPPTQENLEFFCEKEHKTYKVARTGKIIETRIKNG